MTEAFRAEIAAITTMLQGAILPGDIRDTVIWCIGQLPALYDKFCQTYEQRYAEEILRLEQGILGKMAPCRLPSSDAQTVGDRVLERLRLLNERCGLPGLSPKIPRAARLHPRKPA